jgi:energy-coupling factor transporter ATP-binding protein EcfA2
VVSVEATDRDDESRSYRLQIDPDRASDIQRSVTRLAAESNLTVIDASHVREDLEDVFLRLVDTKEHAA